MAPQEVWRPVVGYEGAYEVSSHGRVVSYRKNKNGRLLSTKPGPKGYPQTCLWDGERAATRPVHGLVAEAFIGPRPEGHQVRHLDGNPQNCRLDNLAYGTPSENQLDSVRHGTHLHARKTHCAKGHEYTPDNVYRRGPDGRHRDCRRCEIDRANLNYARRIGRVA